jgi:hypothetical protein
VRPAVAANTAATATTVRGVATTLASNFTDGSLGSG